MKQLTRFALTTLLLLLPLGLMTSCDEDDMIETTLEGQWRVVEVSSYHSPYRSGDRFYFYDNGELVTHLRTGEREYGTWRVRHQRLQIDFTGDGRYDVDAEIPRLDGDYVVLDVHDYYYDEYYRLRMVREGY